MSHDEWRVEVSSDCIGAGLCMAVAPEHFDFVNAQAVATSAPVATPDELNQVRTAVEYCPISAISLLAVEGS